MNLFLLPTLRIFFLLLFSFGFLQALDFTDEEKSWITLHHSVLVGVDQSWEPFDFINEKGEHDGMSADYLRIISAKTGLHFVIGKQEKWADVLHDVQEKKLDMIAAIAPSEERDMYLDFTDAYMRYSFVLATSEKENFSYEISDLRGKKIGVIKSYLTEDILREKYPHIKIVTYENVKTLLKGLALHEIDAAFDNAVSVAYYIKKQGYAHFKMVTISEHKRNIRMGITKNNRILLSIINKVLESISSQEKQKIRDKWVSFDYKKTIDYTLISQLIGLFIFFVLGTLYWTRKLSAEVQKRKESESQMAMLIDNIPLNVIVSSFDGSVLRANAFALQTFNILAEDIYSYNVSEFYVNPFERDMIMETIKFEGKVSNNIVKFKRLNANEMSIMISIIPIIYNDNKALLSIMVDLTERIQMEENLRDAKVTADSANRSKSEFLANMSHEIRTPMNAIIGFTELLNEQVKEPRLKGYIKTIKSAGHSLLTLINDILDLSKIEAGKLEINKTSVNLFDLSDDIGNIFTMSVKNKGLEFIIEVDENIPKSLLLDEIRLRQILVNLVGNAIKFTDEGYVKLKMYAVNVNEHQSKLDLQIEIEDSGMGIPKNQLEHIFNAFEQQEGQDNRKFGGTGLGLSISNRLIKMMGGNISLGSTAGEGTTFFVHFYNVEISAVEAENKKDDSLIFNAQTIVFKPATVLVVDDIKDNRELIVNNFENTALKMITASDGQKAISQYEKEKPDLILMDIRMPNMDGYEAASKIRQMGDTPIVALTASVMKDECERIKNEHFDGYLRKPVLRDDLFLELSHHLSYTHVIVDVEEEKMLVLGDNAQKNLHSILLTMEDEIAPLYEQAINSNNITDIKYFTKRVHSMAFKYDIKALKEYVVMIEEAIDSFDIAKMKFLLKEYSHLKTQLELL